MAGRRPRGHNALGSTPSDKTVVVVTTVIAEASGVDTDGFKFKASLSYTASCHLVFC